VKVVRAGRPSPQAFVHALASIALASVGACALVQPKPAAPAPPSGSPGAIGLVHPIATSSIASAITSTAVCAPSAVASRDTLEEDEESDDGVPEEAESREGTTSGQAVLRYTTDISDDALAEKWKANPTSLGSISIGFADEGRLVNGVQFPCGDGNTWTVVSPENTWGTSETIAYVLAAVERVKALHPNAPPLRVNQISAREGGYLRPHRSHQNGRDVDLAFYYPTATPVRAAARERVIDVPLTWELLKAIVTLTDVQVVLVDKRVQKVLYDYALGQGEDRAWLDTLFHAGRTSLVQHARRHRDHFHVRFFNARAQELGRRVSPLLAQRPDQNLAMVRVKQGDTLGGIATRYRSSVSAIQKANHMKNSFLRIAQVLKVPMRGPCTQCPIPPPVEVPPRRLPPSTILTAATRTTSISRAR
jgi:murein endopeptidase